MGILRVCKNGHLNNLKRTENTFFSYEVNVNSFPHQKLRHRVVFQNFISKRFMKHFSKRLPSLRGGHSLPNISQRVDSPSSRHRIYPFEQGWKNCSCLVFGSFGCLFAFGYLSIESRSRSFQPCFRGWSKNTERLKFVKSRYTCTVVPYWMDFHHKLHDIDLIKLTLWSISRNVCIRIGTNISSGQSIMG